MRKCLNKQKYNASVESEMLDHGQNHGKPAVAKYRGPAHGDIFRIFPSGSSHVRGQQCTVAIEEKRFSHRGAATQAVILKTVCLL